MSRDRFNPVPLDIDKTRKRWSRDPAFAKAYDALSDEFAALAELVRARQQADMTQADVAERMGVAQATVARLESSAGSRKHAPSMATLRRYADAVGCVLLITLAPKPAAKKPNLRSSAR
ncbi:helix-turn-helix transcriptional regulator [Tahibacter soli]|jgi:DNA-binding XRE family transcriptional regulator|uniref:Helix-turn-helix transcriptional regulator n=1 Tax=Tahibacter soli TaxID=2983605 RepID=A0A9X4BFN1_9GAMM|nr:helix-turn-helix transcriptional regulator [Tahibacter soli]MDC8011415.1 helix-turn-helix transcriptional regulator [Tahibacter soli]